jgi:hypothetical protein
MKHEWVTGFDPLAEWIGDEEDVEGNSGDKKLTHMVRSVTFEGRKSHVSVAAQRVVA